MSTNRTRWSTAAALAAFLSAGAAAQAVSLVNTIVVPGDSTDLSAAPGINSANVNRLGMFSDLYYDRAANVYYGLSDRGAGGGTLAYETRVQKFTLDVDLNTGAISNFNVVETIKFNDAGAPLNGLNPLLLNGSKSTLGRSFDPEGFVVGRNGNHFVSDEYGPSVKEFTPDGKLVHTFTPPANVLPKDPNGTLDFVNGRGTSGTDRVVTGRQDNRGFEGLTISPDGKKLYAVLQDTLVNEGTDGDADLLDGEGRRSNNVRVIEYDVATGQPGKQFIYQLESVADINGRIPGDANDFAATAQGRNIGLSSITAINDHQFLVIERDNRGLGVEDPLAETVVGSKRVYLVDISGATDVSAISLNNTNTLPPGVTAVSKSATPYIDLQQALEALGQIVPEKLEGLTVGPQLNDGSYLILLGTDNDYSVTQNDSGTQFDVLIEGDPLLGPITNFAEVELNGEGDEGFGLIPGYLYAFKTEAGDEVSANFVPLAPPVPEPATAALGVIAVGGLGVSLSRRRR